MKYRQLGKSDLQVSEISFGCMSLGNNQAENNQLLRHALDQGINLFDTADLYEKGENETRVGKACHGIRQKVILATKVGNQWRPDGSGWDWNPTKPYILKAAEESLKRLQTDYIDLYQLHGGTITDPMDETIEAFQVLQQQGKIRYYGISSIRPNVIREYIRRSDIVSVMMQYSLLDRRPEESCLDELVANKISVLARGSLAKGLLVNKPAVSYLNYSPQEVQQAKESIVSLADENKNATAIALRFVLHHPAVAAAVVGIRTQAQMEDCLAMHYSPPPTEAQMQFLRNAVSANVYTEHR